MFKQIQDHAVTVSEQHFHLASLQELYLRVVESKGPLPEVERSLLMGTEWLFSDCQCFAAKHLLMNQGSFVMSKLKGISEAEVDSLVKDAASLYINAVAGISEIVAAQDSRNKGAEKLPLILPHELAVMEHFEFCGIVRNNQEQLSASWSASQIDMIEQEHQDLVAAYNEEVALQECLTSYNNSNSMTVHEGWRVLKGRFITLQKFCGGLATVFPGTSHEESNFSIIKAKKDVYRQAVTDLSLEEVFQAKQFDKLAAL